jgi:hypothetical protein
MVKIIISILYFVLFYFFSQKYLASRFFILSILFIGFLFRNISNPIISSNAISFERASFFDDAFSRASEADLNEQDRLVFSLMVKKIFSDSGIRSFSSLSQDEIFHLFLVVNQDNLFTPCASDGQKLLNLKLVLILLTSLDRELGEGQYLKEEAFSLFKKINMIYGCKEEELREKNVFLWNFVQPYTVEQYLKKADLISTLKSFFTMSAPQYLEIVEYNSDLPFYKRLPFRMFGIILSSFYQNLFPYFVLRNERIAVLKKINTECHHI